MVDVYRTFDSSWMKSFMFRRIFYIALKIGIMKWLESEMEAVNITIF